MLEQLVDKHKASIFEECEKLGAPAVRAELERMGAVFHSQWQKAAAWEWLHHQESEAQMRTLHAAERSARWAMWAALASFASAAATLIAAWWHR